MRLLFALNLISILLFHPVQGQDPFEPTVSRKESDFLSKVLSEAEEDPKAAIDLLQKERPKDAESAALDFTLGNLYFQQDNWEEAEAAYRVGLEKMPRFRSALMNLGRILLLQDRPQETIEVYQQLVRDGQADADILMLLGHAMLMEDAPVGAESAYRNALLLRPLDSEIRMGLAKTLLRQERYKEGRALIDELLNREPLNQELWSLRTNALLADANHEAAIQVIEQARRLGQASSGMLATLGDLWINADQPVDALAAYEEAFALEDPSVDRMLRALEGFLMVEDANGATQMVSQIKGALSEEADREAELRLLRLQGELALREDRLEDAQGFLKEVLHRNPLNGQALLSLSDLQTHQGDLQQALLSAERAARISGFEARALLRQARIEVSRGRYARAVPLLESAQAFDPKDHVARYLDQVRRLAK